MKYACTQINRRFINPKTRLHRVKIKSIKVIIRSCCLEHRATVHKFRSIKMSLYYFTHHKVTAWFELRVETNVTE